jgi:hypothetical protein
MNIMVTKADIANGRRMSTSCCPIALACKRRFKTDDVEVDYDAIRVGDRFYETIEYFLSEFDAHGASGVRPARFALEEM